MQSRSVQLTVHEFSGNQLSKWLARFPHHPSSAISRAIDLALLRERDETQLLLRANPEIVLLDQKPVQPYVYGFTQALVKTEEEELIRHQSQAGLEGAKCRNLLLITVLNLVQHQGFGDRTVHCSQVFFTAALIVSRQIPGFFLQNLGVILQAKVKHHKTIHREHPGFGYMYPDSPKHLHQKPGIQMHVSSRNHLDTYLRPFLTASLRKSFSTYRLTACRKTLRLPLTVNALTLP